MWSTFAVGFCLCILLLYVPAAIQLRFFGFNGPFGISLSPAIAVCELSLIGAGLGLLGLRLGWQGPIAFYLLITILAGFVFGKKSRRLLCPNQSDWILLLAYMCVGVLVGVWYFVWNLDGPLSFVQEFDNAFHLNLIHAYMKTERFSIFQATVFPSSFTLLSDLSFYPAAWHVVCALVGSILGLSASMAENVGIAAFLLFVFPSSIYAFTSVVFHDSFRLKLTASFFMFAFASFPWGFLVAGPLYSNFASFSLLPGVLALFIKMIECNKSNDRARWAAVFVLASIALALSQPNSIFTAAFILLPYVFIRPFITDAIDGSVRRRNIQRVVLFSIAVFFLLVVVFNSSSFSAIVHYPHSSYASTSQAVVDFINFGYRNSVSQWPLTVLVSFGILVALLSNQHIWLIPSLVYFGIGYVLSSSVPANILTDFMTGFWYNDVDRIAANCVFVLIPLATLGFCFLLDLLCNAIDKHDMRTLIISYSFALAFCLAMVFAPSHIDAGNGWVNTAFGSRANRLKELSTTAISLTDDEVSFLHRCKDVVGDSLIINNPYDGSAFAYVTADLNIARRQFFASNSGDNLILDRHLNKVSWSRVVRNAVKNAGVQYVLQLDQPNDSEASFYGAFYDPDKWTGVLTIGETTPGFECILSDGDMRLYRIVD